MSSKTSSRPANQFRALSRYVRVSPSKLRRILSELPGLTYPEACMLLAFLPYTSCLPIISLLRSAAANARTQALGRASTRPTLVITEAFAMPGPRMKRLRPAARGRAWQFLRRTAHITISLTQLNSA